jgi:hypothetical protein
MLAPWEESLLVAGHRQVDRHLHRDRQEAGGNRGGMAHHSDLEEAGNLLRVGEEVNGSAVPGHHSSHGEGFCRGSHTMVQRLHGCNLGEGRLGGHSYQTAAAGMACVQVNEIGHGDPAGACRVGSKQSK